MPLKLIYSFNALGKGDDPFVQCIDLSLFYLFQDLYRSDIWYKVNIYNPTNSTYKQAKHFYKQISQNKEIWTNVTNCAYKLDNVCY